jgi:hypothetical protein
MADVTGVPHRALATALAVAIVAMMLAMPILSATASEASFVRDEAGFRVSMNRPTESEIEAYDMGAQESIISSASNVFLRIFNMDLFELSKKTVGTYFSTIARGNNIGPSSTSQKFVANLESRDVILRYEATGQGSLFIPKVDGVGYLDAAKALRNYVGDSVSAGDVLIISGKISRSEAMYDHSDYVAVDSEHSVPTSAVSEHYYIYGIDVTIGLLKKGYDLGRFFGFVSDCTFASRTTISYDYGGTEYSHITSESPCTIAFSDVEIGYVQGSSSFSIRDVPYPVMEEATAGYQIETQASIRTDSEVNLDSFRRYIGEIPASSANVSVVKTYADVDLIFDDIVLNVIGMQSVGIYEFIGGPVLAILTAAVLGYIIYGRFSGKDSV